MMEICKICSRHFKASENITDTEQNGATDGRKVKVCSDSCRWWFQYGLGVSHGFLLSHILHKLCDGKLNVSSSKGLKTPVPSICTDSRKTTSPANHNTEDAENLEVKTEKAASDIEDFDYAVSFQDDDQYSGSTDENNDDIETLPKLPVRKLSVPARKKCLRKAKTKPWQPVKKKVVPEPQPSKPASVQKETRRTRFGTARKSIATSKKKLLGSKRKLETGKRVAKPPKEKLPKLTENSESDKNPKQDEDAGGQESGFQCEYCSKKFKAPRFLQRHLNRFHPKEIMVCCEVCGEVCKNQKDLNRHMKKKHSVQVFEDEELFHCEQCPKFFNSRRGLLLHKQFVHSHENPVNCKICYLTVKNEIYLKRHMKRSHSDSVICDICGAKFKSRLGLNAHLSAHKGVKSYFCEVCGKGFVRKTSLRCHLQQHNDTDFTCDSCSSSYKTSTSLNLHMLQNHQRGAYFENRLRSVEKLGYAVDQEAVQRHLNRQCITCGESLVSGVCVAHPTDYAITFKCHRCELIAGHVDDLLAHLKDHSGGTLNSSISVSFCCKLCRKVFPRKLYLNQHMKKHHPGASMSSLTMSETTMSYVCHVCGKHFTQKQYLYVHMKQHLQPKSFACGVCDRKFTYKCNMKNHMATHSKDKPFQCDVCFKLFRRQDLLNSHRLVHNPSQSPFKCHICGKGLTRRMYLKKHYQIMHPETVEQELPVY